MRYIADLHIHSLFSRATSKQSHLRGLAAWAAVKGIDVVATGDFTHPGWFAHLHEELLPAEEGLYRLKPDPGFDYAALLPEGLQPGRHPEEIRFILSAEISCIYKRGGRVRKVHNLLYAPDMETVRRINTALANLGNISSDGRPILGLDSRDLLEIVLEHSEQAFLVPAHIWTPWFSLFGSKSGFDRIEDCFADLSGHIFALETGLSSDPAMNRLISALDRYTLISNSDCHSPAKLGREANIFETGLDYFSLRAALREPCDAAGRQRFLATVEFFPEEGKYHCDGHRKCGVCLEPQETRNLQGLCPVCGKDLTVGVLHRVLELADRTEPSYPASSPQVHSLIPLAEIISELLDVGAASNRVMAAYTRLISLFGSEFQLLLDVPLEDIRSQGDPLLAEAIARVRKNEVIRQPGYDGAFGVIRVFSEGERAQLGGQRSLFAGTGQGKTRQRARKATLLPDAGQAVLTRKRDAAVQTLPKRQLNEAQCAAVMSSAPIIAVQAGPGTGKTHTLVSRVERLLEGEDTACTVITFTNKAADELRQRLRLDNADKRALRCRIATFHAFCLELLRHRQAALGVVGPEERAIILMHLFPALSRQERQHITDALDRYFLNPDMASLSAQGQSYLDYLASKNLIDLDDICLQALKVLQQEDDWALRFKSMTGMLFVDEFQDINAVQYELVAALAKDNPVFCIGDPDQAIYGFRGASPAWFYRLLEDFRAERHVLTHNYRNGVQILAAATAVIGHNPQPLPPAAMTPANAASARLYVQACDSALHEARFIADQIEIEVGGMSHRGLERLAPVSGPVASFGDIAVLYRSLRLAEALQTVFAERGIPFQQVDVQAWCMRAPVRLLYSWIVLLSGHDAVAQLLFLLSEEQGIGEVRLSSLQALLRKEASLPDDPVQSGKLLARLMALLTAAPKDLVPTVFIHLFGDMVQAGESMPLPALMERMIATLAQHYGFDPADAGIVRLREHALGFIDLESFAVNLERYSASVLYDPQAAAVTLSTMHAAKGLEFDVVFLAGCEQGLLPITPREHLETEAVQAHIAEERRLFYVGMTRARTSLYCTWCKNRRGFTGQDQGTTLTERRPSPFLFEFSPALISPIEQHPHGRKKRPASRQLSLFDS